MRMFKRGCAVLLFWLSIAAPAWAQIPTTDIAAIIESVVQFVETAAQWETEIQQWEQSYEEVKRLQSLTNRLSGSLNMNSVGEMNSAASTGRRLYQRMGDAFGSGNADAKTQATVVKGAVQDSSDMNSAQQENLPVESQRFNDLAAQSQNAAGVLEAQQAGNQINLEVAQQLQLLRAQMLSQSQAQNAGKLQQLDSADRQTEFTKSFLGKSENMKSTEDMSNKYPSDGK